MNSRSVKRAEAKRLYKEQTKGIPKSQRITFAVFYKNYQKIIRQEKVEEIDTPEDFNFDDMVNINTISDEDLVTTDIVE